MSEEALATAGIRTGSSQTALALQMNDPWFWHKLVPGLTLRDRRPRSAAEPVDPAEIERARDRLAGDGFATVRARIVPRPALLAGVNRIVAAGLPPAFIFVYDEPWQHIARLRNVYEGVLGGPFVIDAGIWAWHVPMGPAHAGLVPHPDYPSIPIFDENERPWGVSSWIALTKATPDNGCMYVIPKRYFRGEPHAANLRDVVALPAEPGDVLFWRPDIWHWGGRSSEYAENPRTALGVEIFRPDAPVIGLPWTDPDEIPDFRRRLALVGANVVRYDRDRSWEVLARRLIELDPAVANGKNK